MVEKSSVGVNEGPSLSDMPPVFTPDQMFAPFAGPFKPDAWFAQGFDFFDGESGVRIEFENFGRVGSECSQNIPAGTCTGRANAKMISASAIFKF